MEIVVGKVYHAKNGTAVEVLKFNAETRRVTLKYIDGDAGRADNNIAVYGEKKFTRTFS